MSFALQDCQGLMSPKFLRHPMVKWAQRSDKIYMTVDLPEAKDVKLKLEPEGRFIFSAAREEVLYEVDLELLDKINVKESKYNVGVRSITCVIKKEEKKWWDRLIKHEGKPPVFLKVDWDKWVDEEDENAVSTEQAKRDAGDKNLAKKTEKKKCNMRKNTMSKWLGKLWLDCLRKF